MRRRSAGRIGISVLLGRAVCVCVLCVAVSGCVLWPSRTATPAPTPGAEVDLHALRPLARVQMTDEGEVAVEFTVHNQGAQEIPADASFGGEWQILDPSGEAVARGSVAQLLVVGPDQEPRIVGRWQGPLGAGSYTIVWGAPRYGASVTYWDLEETEGQIAVASSRIVESDRYPPTTGTRSAEWGQTGADEFAWGAVEGTVVLDKEGGEVALLPGVAQGTYTSPAVDADFCFNAIAPHWRVDLPAGSALVVDARVFREEEGWSPWYALEDAAYVEERDQFFPETPLMVSGGCRFQYRATLTAGIGGASPVLHEVVATYVDSTVGPTTTYAKAFMLSGQAADGVPYPGVITREGWGADEGRMRWPPQYMPSRKIVIHHTVTTNDYMEAEAAKWVRAIYHYHAVTLDWGDIGYNYLVDKYGNVYEGRSGGPDVVAGHVYDYNYGSTGVAVIGTHGNYAESVPANRAAMGALGALSAWEAARAAINPTLSAALWDAETPNLSGHRDFPPQRTSCPGDELYGQLPGLREDVWTRLRAQLFKYNADWVEWEMPSGNVLTAGKTYTAAVEVRNRGWFTWPSDGANPVRLGYRWLDEDGRAVTLPIAEGQRASLAEDVPFGDSARIGAETSTPDEPGVYTLVWDLVHEDTVWFNDAVVASPLLKVTYEVDDSSGPQPPNTSGGLLANGGFEDEGGWTLFETSYPAQMVTQPRRTGHRSLRTGIEPGARNVYSYSSAEQMLTLPAEGEISLRFWYQAELGQGDYTYVYLRGGDRRWQLLLFNRASTTGWVEVTRDLGAYADQDVTLRFGTFNDGRGGASAMYVDDARVAVELGPLPPVGTRTPAPPTATPGPPATRTPTPTPTPTATAPPGGACVELVQNGGFEDEGGWTFANTAYRARYSQAVVLAGRRSLQVGIADPRADRVSYSSAEQRIAVPEGRRAKLRVSYSVPNAGGNSDWGYVLLRPAGGSWRVVRIIRDVTNGWASLEVDVSHYAGDAFSVRVGARNDGRAGGAAVMYVDQVSVEACPR